MNDRIIEEALHDLNRPINNLNEEYIKDLWEQVYCSLTDSADNFMRKSVKPTRVKHYYDYTEIKPKDGIENGCHVISVYSDNLEPAKEVAEKFDLECRENSHFGKNRLDIFIPAWSKPNYDLLAKECKEETAQFNGDKKLEPDDEPDEPIVNKSAAEEEPTVAPEVSVIASQQKPETQIRESVESSLPVTILPHDEVRTYIENIPTATRNLPPKPFTVGYMSELSATIASAFRKGDGTPEHPLVRIFKCSEMTIETGAGYENLKATKEMRKVTGKERSDRPSGFSFKSDDGSTIENKIGVNKQGEEMLRGYIRSNTHPKCKYFISLNNEDLHEAQKDEFIQYLTPSAANIMQNGRVKSDIPGADGAKPVNLKLSGIYMIGNLGHSIIK